MNTIVEKLLTELEKVAELHRKSAEDLETRIKEIRKVAEEGDDDYLYLIVMRNKADRHNFCIHRTQAGIANFEAERWHKLHDETLINAYCACAEKDET